MEKKIRSTEMVFDMRDSPFFSQMIAVANGKGSIFDLIGEEPKEEKADGKKESGKQVRASVRVRRRGHARR